MPKGLDFSGQPVRISFGRAPASPISGGARADCTQNRVVLPRLLPTPFMQNWKQLCNPTGNTAELLRSPCAQFGTLLHHPASRSSLTQPLLASSATRTGTQSSLAPSVPSQQPQQTSVFISYHWDSTEAVLELKRFLIGHGIRVQLDTDKSPDEGSMKVFIEKAMRDCHCVLLAVGTLQNICASENCQSDIEAAYRQRAGRCCAVLLTFCAWPPDSSCAAGRPAQTAGRDFGHRHRERAAGQEESWLGWCSGSHAGIEATFSSNTALLIMVIIGLVSVLVAKLFQLLTDKITSISQQKNYSNSVAARKRMLIASGSLNRDTHRSELNDRSNSPFSEQQCPANRTRVTTHSMAGGKHWTWAATLLQSSGVASRYGHLRQLLVRGRVPPSRILLFSVISVQLRIRAPGGQDFPAGHPG
uniref:TIR domain-containing protein n=1 Tax=Macrostomum lignano TaxID=282301 RepID=A0A1I8FQ21_9PLAT